MKKSRAEERAPGRQIGMSFLLRRVERREGRQRR
jgi:hypothetical protein